MTTRQNLLTGSLLILLCGVARLAPAAGRVELELAADDRSGLTTQQEWGRDLAQAGIANVRIRPMRGQDAIGIDSRGNPSAPIYVVTGVITSGGEVRVPGARFRKGNAAGLARWLEDLAQRGPEEDRPQKTAFGLDVDQFQAVHDGLARPVGTSTQGVTRREVVQEIARRLAIEVKIDPAGLRAMEADKVAEELSGLSCGTALACVVRPLGMCLVPRESGSGGLELAVVAARPDLKAWPVGWEPEKSVRELVPDTLESVNVNVDGVSVAKVLDAVAERLKVPMLLDRNALARFDIEPDKVIVSLPQSRITYSALLSKALFKARLKKELRVDEAGRPFFWITTLKQP
jgi:hypothetical protein